MRVVVTSAADWQVSMHHATRVLELKPFFQDRDYGPGLRNIMAILSCFAIHPESAEITYDRAERSLGVKVVLDYAYFKALGHAGRRRVIAKRLAADVPAAIAECQIPEFDGAAFARDFAQILEEQLLGEDAARFDHLCRP